MESRRRSDGDKRRTDFPDFPRALICTSRNVPFVTPTFSMAYARPGGRADEAHRPYAQLGRDIDPGGPSNRSSTRPYPKFRLASSASSASRSHWWINSRRYCLTLDGVASASSLRARAATRPYSAGCCLSVWAASSPKSAAPFGSPFRWPEPDPSCDDRAAWRSPAFFANLGGMQRKLQNLRDRP